VLKISRESRKTCSCMSEGCTLLSNQSNGSRVAGPANFALSSASYLPRKRPGSAQRASSLKASFVSQPLMRGDKDNELRSLRHRSELSYTICAKGSADIADLSASSAQAHGSPLRGRGYWIIGAFCCYGEESGFRHLTERGGTGLTCC